MKNVAIKERHENEYIVLRYGSSLKSNDPEKVILISLPDVRLFSINRLNLFPITTWISAAMKTLHAETSKRLIN